MRILYKDDKGEVQDVHTSPENDVKLKIGKNNWVVISTFKIRMGYILRVESKNNVELIALQEN